MALPESTLATLRESYLLLPHTYWGVIEWALWGFVDGFIAGTIVSFLFVETRRRLKPL